MLLIVDRLLVQIGLVEVWFGRVLYNLIPVRSISFLLAQVFTEGTTMRDDLQGTV